MASHFLQALLFLFGLISLIGFSFVGQWLAPLLPVVIPAPLLGMLLLFMVLIVLGKIPVSLELAAKPLLAHMSLLFIPAIIGVWHYRELVVKNGLGMFLAVIISTVILLGITAKLADKMQSTEHKNDN